MWEIKKIIHKGDYEYALVPDHPNETKKWLCSTASGDHGKLYWKIINFRRSCSS